MQSELEFCIVTDLEVLGGAGNEVVMKEVVNEYIVWSEVLEWLAVVCHNPHIMLFP